MAKFIITLKKAIATLADSPYNEQLTVKCDSYALPALGEYPLGVRYFSDGDQGWIPFDNIRGIAPEGVDISL